MARVIVLPGTEGPVGRFEQQVVEHLRATLPDGYVLLPNFTVKQQGHDALEYDAVVLAPHAIYVLEAKEWIGRLSGDDTEWLVNQTPRACPLPTVNLKAKVLKTVLALPKGVWVAPLFVVPDGITLNLTGGWADSVAKLGDAPAFIKDTHRLHSSGNHSALVGTWLEKLRGNAGRRQRGSRKRFGGYETTEIIQLSEHTDEYKARRCLVDDPRPYRVRTWYLDPYLSEDARKKRLEVIRRPTVAVSQIGPHDHLLQILHFDELQDEHLFYEVTEWSDYGTLHGYLRNMERERLTLRERLEIALGVALALDAVHGKGLVHRNLCPETILIGFDRKARLTDFDRAWLDRPNALTVYDSVRTRNEAYLPPELENPLDYDFDTSSDMYSFGVLLYELLVGNVPFAKPAEARAAHGRPHELPSAQRSGLTASLDDLILRLLEVDEFKKRPSAAEVVKVLRAELDGSQASRGDGERSAAAQTANFDEGSIVDGVYRIEKRLGAGAYSEVYRIYHLDHERTYAMKLLKGLDQAESAVHELLTGFQLPQHPHIARIIWQDRLRQPPHTPYVLTEYVEGETLEAYCSGRKVLHLRDVRDVGLKLLSALAAIHPDVDRIEALKERLRAGEADESEYDELGWLEQKGGILHRDIKPANIMLAMPEREPKFIDFNIAARLDEAKGFGGTPRYWAPDRGIPNWQPHHDLFSLGIVVYELVLHQHPYPEDLPGNGEPIHPHDLEHGRLLSREFADFLHRAVQPSGVDRFRSAQVMASALRAIESLNAPTISAPGDDDFPLELRPEEQGKKNYNPYVSRLLTLYSQARYTNAGTRGLDDIGRITYVQTRLDRELAPTILDGRFRLVLISGNAGDGKTAFLQQLEREFAQRGAAVSELPSKNGASWTHEELQYRSNYDGSQDEGDQRSDDVLADFLAPFEGELGKVLEHRQARLIAINEGRLLDFLEHSSHRGRFPGLRSALLGALHEGLALPEGILLVNLNLRAVAVQGPKGEPSLVDAQLDRMLGPALWKACESCEHQTRCPLKHNADTMRDPASGKAVRERVRRLYEIVHLRRRQHITMRDLRSSLSWLLLRDHGCDDVGFLVKQSSLDATEQLARLYYPDAFASDFEQIVGTVEDRLVRLLRETDVGLVESPGTDRRLHHEPDKAVGWMTFEQRAKHGWDVLMRLQRNLPPKGEIVHLTDALAEHRHAIARWRRWAYFERQDDRWEQMLPYRSLGLYEKVAMASEGAADGERAREDLRDLIVEAISLSEGVRHTGVRRGYICLRVSRAKAVHSRSFRLFPKERFRVEVVRSDSMRRFLEMAPDAVQLVADDRLAAQPSRAPATLRLSLDLLEMLELIRRGYRPGPSDMRGLFVNLMIFRNELLNLPFERVMVTLDNERFYEIAARTTGKDVVFEVNEARPVEAESGAP
ncbi:protein kinase [Sorangium sp. So ce1036]|uniref:methylation-associated defense system protein kinase MAD6 n=1 Tax=Sorangium sp. So ce1036 TaxID=3133328 RepID=UPI003F0D40C6